MVAGDDEATRTGRKFPPRQITGGKRCDGRSGRMLLSERSVSISFADENYVVDLPEANACVSERRRRISRRDAMLTYPSNHIGDLFPLQRMLGYAVAGCATDSCVVADDSPKNRLLVMEALTRKSILRLPQHI